jgi:hypothetical protein
VHSSDRKIGVAAVSMQVRERAHIMEWIKTQWERWAEWKREMLACVFWRWESYVFINCSLSATIQLPEWSFTSTGKYWNINKVKSWTWNFYLMDFIIIVLSKVIKGPYRISAQRLTSADMHSSLGWWNSRDSHLRKPGVGTPNKCLPFTFWPVDG